MSTKILFGLYDIVIGLTKMIILFYEYENNHLFGWFLFMFFYLRDKYLERKRSKQVNQFAQKIMYDLNVCKSMIKKNKQQPECYQNHFCF